MRSLERSLQLWASCLLAMQYEPTERVKRRRIFNDAEKLSFRSEHVRNAWGVSHPSSEAPRCNAIVESSLRVLSGEVPAPLQGSPYDGVVPAAPQPWRLGVPLAEWRYKQCNWLREVKAALTPAHVEVVRQWNSAIRTFVER